MSTLKLSLLLSIILFTSSCSQFRAFEDRRREPGTEYIYVGSSKEQQPVICYNPLFENKDSLQDMADGLCQKYQSGTKAELIKKDAFSCRLLIPTKAYYKCIK